MKDLLNFPLVSVIVPIYNVEQYLRPCVESILEQSLAEIEIILIDDASPDDSGIIADELAQEYSNIIVIHHDKNKGLGPARNSGINAAKGRFIMFVDSDDWIDPLMVESLYTFSEVEKLDICFCGRRIMSNGVVRKEMPHPLAGTVLTGIEKEQFRKELYGALPGKVKSSPIPVAVWAALYSKKLIDDGEFRFCNIRSEDAVFNIPVCRRAAKIGFHSGVFYNYRKDNQPSITNDISTKSIESYIPLFIKLLELTEAESDQAKEECSLRVSRNIIDLTRGAVSKTLVSSLNKDERFATARLLINNEIFKNAIEDYPIWRAPLSQALFSFFMKNNNLSACELLSKIRKLRD